MFLAITAERMKKIEEKAAEVGITPLLLMENAGKAVAEAARNFGEKAAILACTGNNGGDGFVAARHLASYGARVEVFLIGNPNDIRTGEARSNWNILRKLRSVPITILKSGSDVRRSKRRLGRSDVIVDAMLGTGVRGQLKEPVASAVRLVNELEIPVLAVDVPTGLDPSTGEVCGDAVKADLTVTFHRMKRGLLKAKKYAGRIEVASIGIPREVEKSVSTE